MTPTLCRAVLFQSFRRSAECAAIVTGVHAEGLSLFVMPDGEPGFVATGVKEWQADAAAIAASAQAHREYDAALDAARASGQAAEANKAEGPAQSWRWPPKASEGAALKVLENDEDAATKLKAVNEAEAMTSRRASGAADFAAGLPCPAPDGSNENYRQGWLAAATAADEAVREKALEAERAGINDEAKRAQNEIAKHDSNCAIFNEPAFAAGPCNCTLQGTRLAGEGDQVVDAAFANRVGAADAGGATGLVPASDKAAESQFDRTDCNGA